jgi:hypothetical protein
MSSIAFMITNIAKYAALQQSSIYFQSFHGTLSEGALH